MRLTGSYSSVICPLKRKFWYHVVFEATSLCFHVTYTQRQVENFYIWSKLPPKPPWYSGLYIVYRLSELLCISKYLIMRPKSLLSENSPFMLTTGPLAAIVLLFPPQEILKSWAWVQTRGLHACFEKNTPSTMAGTRPSLWPCRSLHIIDLVFVLADLTPVAHNVQYIKHRQQTNSPWGQALSEARPAVRAAPAVWAKLWSLSRFTLWEIFGPDLLYCNVLNMEHILLQCQHNEVWVTMGSVFTRNAKNWL